MTQIFNRLAASTVLAAAAALGISSSSAAQDSDTSNAQPAVEMTEGQQELAELLEGRVAGEPQNCIRLFPVNNLKIIDETALVYKSGGTLYVNVPRNAEALDDWDAISTRPLGSRLCRTDIVTTFQRHTGIYTGNIFLGDFVPYKRAGG